MTIRYLNMKLLRCTMNPFGKWSKTFSRLKTLLYQYLNFHYLVTAVSLRNRITRAEFCVDWKHSLFFSHCMILCTYTMFASVSKLNCESLKVVQESKKVHNSYIFICKYIYYDLIKLLNSLLVVMNRASCTYRFLKSISILTVDV